MTKAHADHIVGRICGVTEDDTPLEAALKALEMMRRVGMPKSAIRKAEKIVEQIRMKKSS